MAGSRPGPRVSVQLGDQYNYLFHSVTVSPNNLLCICFFRLAAWFRGLTIYVTIKLFYAIADIVFHIAIVFVVLSFHVTYLILNFLISFINDRTH